MSFYLSGEVWVLKNGLLPSSKSYRNLCQLSSASKSFPACQMFLDPHHQGIQLKNTIYPFLWCYWERWLCFISSVLVQRKQSFHCRECQGLYLSFSEAISFLLWLCTCFGCWGFVLRKGFNPLLKVTHFVILSFRRSFPTITQSKKIKRLTSSFSYPSPLTIISHVKNLTV